MSLQTGRRLEAMPPYVLWTADMADVRRLLFASSTGKVLHTQVA